MADVEAVLRYEVLDTHAELGFDDVAALAAQMCDVPTALVSLIDVDRQWFKARVGFEPEQTDLNRSVCRHVVAAAATIVIPDLTLDARTCDNPLVTGEPHIRFYAGAPLATRYGIVGALCVIDTVPRPAGLTDLQRSGLERLARQVVALLEARRGTLDLEEALQAKGGAEAATTLSEGRWRTLYQNMDQGFVYAHVLRDAEGRIRDWRYEDVNPAWGRLVGIDPEDARGRTVRELIPGVEDEWVIELASVVETREPLRFTRQVGALERWYDGVAQWVGDHDFTVIFTDATSRVEGERRRDALLAIGDMIRDSDSSTGMMDAASALIGPAVGASRATVGEMDHARERIRVEAGWALPGMPPIAGDYRFDDYGRVREYLVRGETFVVDDVEADARVSDEAAGWLALKARAVVNVPVRDAGRTSIVLIVHRERSHAWTGDEIAFLRDAAARLENALVRRRDRDRQDVVNGEIAHRLKNALAMAQAVATQTLRDEASAAALDTFTQRLQALGMAHDALTAGRWKAALLGDVVAGVLDVAGVRDRCKTAGPAVELGARAALSASLLLHELATNAVKYGALSVDGGSVLIDWRFEGSDDNAEVVLDWVEKGGPPVVAPTRRGFGSRLVRVGLVGTGGSDVRYERDGLKATFRAPFTQLEQA